MFLENLAKHIVSKEGDKLANYCFVFPNRRSGLFFKKFLLRYYQGTEWAPKTTTINDLMKEISGLEEADPLDVLFTIYDLYANLTDLPEPFDKFYPWGEMMLHDFDNLDKYLVNPESIFKNIQELKEIDDVFGELEQEQIEFIRLFWKSFHQGEMTKEKDLFLYTWKILPIIYKQLVEVYFNRGEAYEGMMYRKAATLDVRELDEKLKYDHYYFIGFNALSACEKRLFSHLQQKEIASFYWDYDQKYIEDKSMEAGRFLRENILKFPSPDDLSVFSSLADDRRIRIFDLPTDVLQAKTVFQLINERTDPIVEANDTAVIACNENLLMPLLYSLPEQVKQLNITMGYPFSNTPLNSFIEAVLRLHRKVRSNKSGNILFYHKDVLSVLNHQYFKMICDDNPQNTVDKIISQNIVYIEEQFFKDRFYKLTFRHVATAYELCDYLNDLLHYILEKLIKDEENYIRALEKEYLLVLLSRLNKLTELLEKRPGLEKLTFIRLFKRLTQNLRIPFTGEPLAGLQIMGILETRLLDFDNIIMLSVNEEIMPRSSSGNSFIPYSMRYAYGLPTREDMDAIYAYYFYRLLQGAKKVDLLFKSASEGVRSGEMSRYLYQMKYEFDAEIIRPVLPVTTTEIPAIVIKKTPEIMSQLEKYLEGNIEEKYLSPSSLNTYIDCSLKFYFRKILSVGEQDELLEEIDAIGFGNILHKTIHNLYDGLRKQKDLIQKNDLEELLKGDKVERTLLDEFRKVFFKSESNRELEGKNLIIFAILKKYLFKIIETDIAIAPIEILDLEKNYTSVIKIESATEQLKILVGGQIDRIDRSNGVTRIIDYKTGVSEKRFRSIDSLFDRDDSKRNKEAFQALVYASLYLSKHPEQIVQPGLYIIRKLYQDDFSPEFKMGERNDQETFTSFNGHEDKFSTYLKSVLGELYNPEIPFKQTTVIERCSYCDFKGICQRT